MEVSERRKRAGWVGGEGNTKGYAWVLVARWVTGNFEECRGVSNGVYESAFTSVVGFSQRTQ